METLFQDFKRAHLDGSGPLLASTLEPVAPFDDPNRLRRLYRSSTSSTIVHEMRNGLLAHSHTSVRFTKQEGQAWVDVYVAHWKAIGEIVQMGEGTKHDWSAIYGAWKDMTNALIKGYSGSHFAAWTVPCLYVAGKYLRVFAINADLYGKPAKSLNFNGGLQNEIAGDFEKNEKLEDAARVLNRVFTLCISDRSASNNFRRRVILTSRQCARRGVTKMGALLHDEPSLQNLLQGKPSHLEPRRQRLG